MSFLEFDGYKVLNKQGQAWGGRSSDEVLPLATAAQEFKAARQACPTSWRLVPVSSEKQGARKRLGE